MKKLLLSFLLLIASVAAHAAPSIANSCTDAQASTTALGCSVTGVTSGDLIVIRVASHNTAVTNLATPTGTGGCNGTFTSRGNAFGGSADGIGFWSMTATSTATCVVAYGKNAQNAAASMKVDDITGWDGTTPTDGAAVFANGTSTSLTVGMTSTSVANDLLLGYISSFDTTNVTYTTAQSGFTAGTSVTLAGSINSKPEQQTTSTSGVFTCGWSSISNAFSRNLELGCLAIRGPPITPTITSTSPTPSVSNGATLTINGTLLKDAGNSTVTFGGISQTVTVQSTTAPQITVSRGTNKYGSCQGSAQTGLPLILTNSSSAASNTFSTTGLIPQSSWDCSNLSTLATSGTRITAIPGLASGDQLAYDTKGTCSGAPCVVVNSDGTFVADPTVTSFTVEAWTSGTGWGAQALQTINSASGSGMLFGFH